MDKNQEHQAVLISNIKAKLPELMEAQEKFNSEWVYEELVYRFYHHSFKVFHRKESIQQVVDLLRSLDPKPQPRLNIQFTKLVEDGLRRDFDDGWTNDNWMAEASPVVLCFFHVKHMLDMIVKYGKEITEPQTMLDFGWASVLYLYGIR